ncbi:hypothetical protein AVEN_137153-1 [Araneus ventricosus]|uniref:Uncharacterized protein n=1 Tax=Araneus ventricosus TaxID=182803 RepID=A0A4Y2Q4B8_ARAVE|nr:hypothetical protein AVEN_137153-1 [Araneus ventricosus]
MDARRNHTTLKHHNHTHLNHHNHTHRHDTRRNHCENPTRRQLTPEARSHIAKKACLKAFLRKPCGNGFRNGLRGNVFADSLWKVKWQPFRNILCCLDYVETFACLLSSSSVLKPSRYLGAEKKVQGHPPRDPFYAPAVRAVHILVSRTPKRPRLLSGRRVASPGQVRKCIAHAHHPAENHLHQTLSWLWSSQIGSRREEKYKYKTIQTTPISGRGNSHKNRQKLATFGDRLFARNIKSLRLCLKLGEVNWPL